MAPETDSPDTAPDLAKLKRYFTEAEQLTFAARSHSLRAIDYYDSDQFGREELAKLHERKQPAIVINRIKPAINGIIGVTERGRSDPRAWPRNPGNDDAADAATDVLRFIADFNRFKRVKQDCFKDLLVPGTMAALVGVDPDSQVTITQVRWEELRSPLRHRPDPQCRGLFVGGARSPRSRTPPSESWRDCRRDSSCGRGGRRAVPAHSAETHATPYRGV